MSDSEPKRIVDVGRMNQNAVLVEYSDNTSVIYSVDQLAALKPQEIVSEDDIEEEDAEQHERKILQFPQRTRLVGG